MSKTLPARRPLLVLLVLTFAAMSARAQDTPEEPAPEPAAARVEVEPLARDDEIRKRLEDILGATGWFADVEVRVREGVVFLEGRAQSERHREWAGDLTRSTRDVAAVVNRMTVVPPPIWDFQPAVASLRDLGRGVVSSLPLVAFGSLILVLSALAAWGAARLARRLVRHHALTPFLRDVAARTTAVVVLVLGFYVVLRVAGLTTVALTVMGGTGLIGLILGIAFRGITENFLASLFLSIQKPFQSGDLVEITSFLGYVQRLTNRATVLMTLDGNHVQIPNSTVYQSAIRNFSSNPNRREDFCVGIGYADTVADAQRVALRVLAEHPAVLKNPEPWVLVDDLGTATVSLRIYFWLDGSRHSWLKVRSSVIRSVKRAFQAERISMPDAARERLFPDGVVVRLVDADAPAHDALRDGASLVGAWPGEDDASIQAEAGLHTDARDIEAQARRARVPEGGENLLSDDPSKP